MKLSERPFVYPVYVAYSEELRDDVYKPALSHIRGLADRVGAPQYLPWIACDIRHTADIDLLLDNLPDPALISDDAMLNAHYRGRVRENNAEP